MEYVIVKKISKKIINYIGEKVFVFLFRNAYKMSYEKMVNKSAFLTSLYCKIDKKRVAIAENNIRLAFKDQMSEDEIKKLARESMKNFLFEAFMFFSLAKTDQEKIKNMVTFHNTELIKKALEREKGCIFLTAHYGNWEIMARRVCMEGFPVNVIARDSDNLGMTEITQDIRESGGYKVFSKNQPLTGIIRALRNNECLGILPDQHDYSGIRADFFGRPAKTSVGCANLSLKTGAAIIPMYCHRVDFGKYEIEVYPEIQFEQSGDKQKDIKDLTQLVNNATEVAIRKHPEHWLWIHNRWK